jgi:tRNA (guanine-N7-)-methyltransferase
MLSDADYFLVETTDQLLDYSAVFGNDNPVYIEIGSGKGEFISQYPLLHPDKNFLGFEVRRKRINNILKKIDPQQHPNVRLIEVLVDEKISLILPAASIDGCYIQHPDPWPKRRHHKRRLFQAEFLKALASILKPGAFVQIATDHEEYAQWIIREFAGCDLFASVQEDPISDEPHLSVHVVTFFEREQRRLGFEPNFMMYKRI